MKPCSRRFCTFSLLAAAIFAPSVFAEDGAAALPPYRVDLGTLHEHVSAKRAANQETAGELASQIAEFDTLLAKYHGQAEAEVAIAMDRAWFTLMVLKDESAAKTLAESIKKDYPAKGTDAADKLLAFLAPEAKAAREAKIAATKAKRDALLGATAPELDIAWSTHDGLKKIADLQGNVVVLDFWATWCGPCIRSFPKLREAVARFAHSPVVFLGVTSLQGKVYGLESKPIDVPDDPTREYALTAAFQKKHEMTWAIAFSARNVFNPDYLVPSIPCLVIIAPDGKVRYLGLNPHTPGVDIEGKIAAILKEFNLPGPS